MDSIAVRYGEDLTLPIDTGDTTDVSATIYIGKPGEVYVRSKTASLTNGLGAFVFDGTEMEIPLDTYYYQVNITDSSGAIEKYPSPNPGCEDCTADSFPEFIVCEALDQTEVS